MSLAGPLLRAVSLLDEAGLPYMVIGGFATLIWGEPRATTDVDLTVDAHALGTDAFAALAARLGSPLVDDPAAFAARNRVLPVRTPEGIEVDLILATLPFELGAIDRAATIDVEGTPVRVVTPEDLILHKVVSERARDLEDVVGVLRRQRDRLDLEALDAMVDALVADLQDPAIAGRYRQAKRSAGMR